MLLVDTNVWLELLLEQAEAEQARRFFEATATNRLVISEFSLYSIGIILTRLGKDEAFADFLSDTLESSGVRRARLDVHGLSRILTVRRQSGLDFDDAYQYVTAETYDLTIVSFDRDFDRTERGRRTPAEAMGT
jgi:predicted nucleic acid-binding protein